MHLTPTTIIGLALFGFVLALLPDKYKPKWIYRLNWWQMLIGLIAVVAAIVILATPEFCALGLLGDSTFFDILVLAISIQLQVILSRIGVRAVSAVKWTIRRMVIMAMLLAMAAQDMAAVAQKVVHRLLS
ncbi:MAG TPA: hypothetical protein VMF08_13350 [Candidatus Sulfotelmatobacter sp.]|nr:hypothetical protein [Candidatus Sulfotelmatobacter sp.]